MSNHLQNRVSRRLAKRGMALEALPDDGYQVVDLMHHRPISESMPDLEAVEHWANHPRIYVLLGEIMAANRDPDIIEIIRRFGAITIIPEGADPIEVSIGRQYMTENDVIMFEFVAAVPERNNYEFLVGPLSIMRQRRTINPSQEVPGACWVTLELWPSRESTVLKQLIDNH